MLQKVWIKKKKEVLINRNGNKPLFDNQWLNIKDSLLGGKNCLWLYELLLFIQREEMTIEFLTRISWPSSLPGSGIWAWLAGRFREERLKPAPGGITKTTRTCEWAGADSSKQFPFTPFFLHPLSVTIFVWSPGSVPSANKTSLLLPAIAAGAAFQRHDLKPYPSKFMKYSACVCVDLWTFTFYLSALQLIHPFFPLVWLTWTSWKRAVETPSSPCHGKVFSVASWQNCSLPTRFPCCVAHPVLSPEILKSISEPRLGLQVKAHFAWCG